MLRTLARFGWPKQPLCGVGNEQVPIGIDFPLNCRPALFLSIVTRNQGVALIHSRNRAGAVNSRRLPPAVVIGFPRESAVQSQDNPGVDGRFSFPVGSRFVPVLALQILMAAPPLELCEGL